MRKWVWIIAASAIAVALATTVVAMGSAWNDLVRRVDAIDGEVASLRDQNADVCLEIVGRQLQAIKKGVPSATEKLERLSSQYKCSSDTRGYATTTGLDHPDLPAPAAEELLRIDNELNPIDLTSRRPER